MKQPVLSIIIPVYNEKNTVEKLVNKVDKVKINKQVIIVDDGSADGSKEIIEKLKTKSHLIKKAGINEFLINLNGALPHFDKGKY